MDTDGKGNHFQKMRATNLLLESNAAVHGVGGIVLEDAARGVDGQMHSKRAMYEKHFKSRITVFAFF